MLIDSIFNPVNTNNCYVIAEIGINHEGSFDTCAKMVAAAASAGADAIKLQTIDPDRNYSPLSESYDLFKKSMLSQEETSNIFRIAKSYHLEAFTTVGDLETLDWIKKLNPACYKISSGLLTCIPIIEEAAKLGKPMLMSTGMAKHSDISAACDTVLGLGNRRMALFQCTSKYPAKNEDLNLSTIGWLRNFFKCPVGFSDHSKGDFASTLAVASGAVMIEKHITFDKKKSGFDHKLSLEPHEFSKMVKSIREVEQILGEPKKDLSPELYKTRLKMSRYLGAISDIKPGALFSKKNIGFLRFPSDINKLFSSEFKNILGKKSSRYIKKHSPLTKEDNK